MNAQFILTSVKNNAAYIGRVIGLALLLAILLLFALSSFIQSLDAFWDKDASTTVVGVFLGLCFLFVSRIFWRKLLKSL